MRSRVVLLILGCLLAGPAVARPLNEPERALLAEARAVVAAVGDRVWSGWNDVRLPLVFVTGDVEFGVGFGRVLEGAEAVAPLGEADVCVRPRTFPPGLGAAFFVEGVPAVVIGSPETTEWEPTLWVAKAAHELFHVLQYSRGGPAKVRALEIGPEDDPSWQLDYPFPYDSDAVMRSVHTLGYCLHQAMTAGSDADRNYAAGTADDARVALRALLEHETGDDTAFRYARFQMHNEGVALWTEREVVRLAAESHVPSPEFLALPGAVPYGTLWNDAYAGTHFLVKHAGRAARSRGLFYHLGFGMAAVLDRLDPAWRRSYFDPDVWLDDLLKTHVDAACAVPADPGR